MPMFRKKPIVIEAWKWDGNEAVDTRPDWVQSGDYQTTADRELVVPTRSGVRYASPGDWIIRDAMGGIYPCKPHIFHEGYEVIED